MTPLNGILGFSEILREDLDKIPIGESRQMLADIETCARRLHRTLLNYINLVSLEGDVDEAPIPPPIPADRSVPLISGIAQDIAQKHDRRRDVEISVEPLAFLCRDDDLRVIVEHVIENAFGYSPSGSPVIVSFALLNGHPTLRVRDQGRGMTPDQIEQIGMFMQFDRKRFEQQGLGIGLALVNRLLKRSQGRFRFESALGRGTTVWVEFRPAP
jgi:two-component system sensor histidine kinase/response regulator